MQSTVAPYLQRTCCLPEQSLRQWLANLKLTAGVEDRLEKERTRERYYAALKPMRNTHNWDTWLVEYDQASSDAAVYGVPEVQDIDNITKDFLLAVIKVAPMWATNFQDTGRFNPLITRKEMMKRFREHMSLHHPLKTVNKKQAFCAGADESSFLAAGGATTQGSQRDASAATESAPSKPHGRTHGGKRQGYQSSSRSIKRSSEHEASQPGRKCPACEQAHGIKDCWYINDDQAPEWWQANAIMRTLVEYKRKHDPILQGALRGTSRTKSRTPKIKGESQTPNTQELDDDQQ